MCLWRDISGVSRPCNLQGWSTDGSNKDTSCDQLAKAKNLNRTSRIPGPYRLLPEILKNYGTIARPLTNMTKKRAFRWEEDSEKAFEELKQAVSTIPVLAMPNFEKLFEVHMDASDRGIGIVLVQEGRPLAFLSKALGPRRWEWSVYVKEMMTVLEAVRIWRPYLIGRNFRIVTDQQPLKHLLKQRIITPE